MIPFDTEDVTVRKQTCLCGRENTAQFRVGQGKQRPGNSIGGVRVGGFFGVGGFCFFIRNGQIKRARVERFSSGPTAKRTMTEWRMHRDKTKKRQFYHRKPGGCYVDSGGN